MGLFYVPLYPSPPDYLFVTFLPRKLVQVDKLVCACLLFGSFQTEEITGESYLHFTSRARYMVALLSPAISLSELGTLLAS